MLRILAAALTLLIAACAGSPPPLDTSDLPPEEETKDWQEWGPEENLSRRISGEPLTQDEITRTFVGRTLEGCYANGEPLSEILNTEGLVIDPTTGTPQARYAIQNNQLCFAYPNQNPACYMVTRYGSGHLFYTAGGFRLVASTICPIPENVKGRPGNS